MHFPRRFQIIPSWIRSRFQAGAHRVPLVEVCRFLTQPAGRTRGFRYVTSCQLKDDAYEVRLHGCERPIFWPAHQDLDTLGMLIHEQFCPQDWHFYRIPETDLSPADIVVDCGAAEGLFTLIAQPICRKVYAVEPLPLFVGYLRKIFRECANVEIVPALASNRSATQAFLTDAGIMSAELAGPQAGAVTCPVITLDEFFATRPEKPTYLKADVEGAELKLLQGAQQLLREHRPKLAITTYHYSRDAAELTDFIRSINPQYQIRCKGMALEGHPMMLHAW